MQMGISIPKGAISLMVREQAKSRVLRACLRDMRPRPGRAHGSPRAAGLFSFERDTPLLEIHPSSEWSPVSPDRLKA